jgi:hypothetical protein
MAAIEGMIPGAEQLPSALPGDGKQGQFDLVYRGPDGTIYIVEAKGGSAELGTDLADPTKDPRKNQERLRILMETMGIKHPGDEGFKLLVDKLGLNIPPDVKAWIDTHMGKDAEQQMIMDVLHKHVKTSGFDGTFVKGCHDIDSFMQHMYEGRIEIKSQTPRKSAGVTNIEYHPVVNGSPKTKLNPETNVTENVVGKKTVYDPSIWTDSKLIQSATEAWNDPTKEFFLMPPQSIESWRGKDADGNTIVGHVRPETDNKEITTFWPE